jgi:hypothetical protein
MICKDVLGSGCGLNFIKYSILPQLLTEGTKLKLKIRVEHFPTARQKHCRHSEFAQYH